MSRLRRDERGLTIIFAALSMVVLLGFAAFAIDAAHGQNQRAEDQAASDTGGIAAGLEVSFETRTQAIAAATAEVMRITNQNISPGVTPEQWAACTDPTRPGSYSVTGTTDCVSFTSNLSQIRVKVPDVDVNTVFGGVIGKGSIETNAFAEIAAMHTIGAGTIMPIGIPPGSDDEIEVCLRATRDRDDDDDDGDDDFGGTEACDEGDDHRLRFLEFTRFGDPAIGTSPNCSIGNNPSRALRIATENIAHGVDHGLDGIASGRRPESATCGTNYTGAPNETTAIRNTEDERSDAKSAIERGFVKGRGGFEGRLRHVVSGPPFQTIVMNSGLVDDTPLWAFLTPAASAACGSPTERSEMVDCLDDWSNADDGVIFQEVLSASPRMVWIPVLDTEAFGDVGFDAFHPVYVNTFYTGCRKDDCEVAWNAGEGTPTPPGSASNFDGMSVLQLDEHMLPQSHRDLAPPSRGQFQYVITR
ncbi:MAG: hypothetical protein ACE5GC_08435 [Acidimicrobiia bacterium]